MATIVTRAGKGSPLTHDEVDDNFSNLNTDKVETSAIGTAAAANTGDFATAAQGTLADSALQNITGESIENLSDVASMTPSDGQALVYGSGVWSAADMAGGIAYTRHTANVTMAANEGVIADTSGGAFTVTLPASPAVGDTVVIADGADWATTNLTVGRNGSTIEGDAADMTMDIGGVAVQFTYDNTTWQIYTQLGANSGNVVVEGSSPTFGSIIATGAAASYTDTGLYLQNKGSSVFDVGAWRSGASVAELTFSTDSGSDAAPSEAMRIDSGGNVGIGKTNPATALDVDGTVTTTSLVVNGNNYPSAGPLSNRNILINGNLNVNQRSLSIASVATGAYGEDRWKKTAGGMTQIVEEVNYLSSTVYTLSGTGVTTQQITSPASGNWTLPDIPVTARLIQLELGNTATPFEHRSYGQELALCQRYYQAGGVVYFRAYQVAGAYAGQGFELKSTMRATPTFAFGGDATWSKTNISGNPVVNPESNSGYIAFALWSTSGDGRFQNTSGSYFTFDAEI